MLSGTATYTVTPTSPAGCTGTPITVVVTVNPTPTATATPSSQTICSGSTTSIALSSNVPGTTFSWTVMESGVTGASDGSGSSIAQTLTTTTQCYRNCNVYCYAYSTRRLYRIADFRHSNCRAVSSGGADSFSRKSN